MLGRRALIAAAGALALAAALLGLSRREAATPDGAGERVAERASGGRGASPRASLAAPAAAPAAAPPLPPTIAPSPTGATTDATARAALQQRTGEALGRFAYEAQPALDACLGPRPGLRAPRTFLVRFRREPGEARFAAIEARPTPSPGPPDVAVERCAQSLVGRALDLDDPALARRAELDEVVTLLLPAGGPAPSP